jgi:hypothetical protein
MMTLKTHDLNPDGVRIVVDWGAMVVGSSTVISGSHTGVRVWRLV